MEITGNDALIVVDVQNDFAPGGALGVTDGNLVVPIINRLEPYFEHVVMTRDWHPADHCSFDDGPRYVDGSWPAHCVQDTPGAEFVADLHVPVDAPVVSKATEPDVEAYSGFEGTGLAEMLRERGVSRVFLCGLATDYCVKATALDAKAEGFESLVVLDACRPVDNPRGSVNDALDAMREACVRLVQSADVLP